MQKKRICKVQLPVVTGHTINPERIGQHHVTFLKIRIHRELSSMYENTVRLYIVNVFYRG